jgi:RNA:NAD 2'-phosphotransferase (TPT1/KptA family)
MESEATGIVAGKGQRNKRRWSDLSARQQQAIVVGAVVELVMTTIAAADLARRPASHVRGSKPLWLVSFVIQPFGPILYLLVGRRRTSR